MRRRLDGVATTSFRALGTTAVVAVTERRQLPLATALLRHELSVLDATCSRFRADSELARANTRAGSDVPISRLLATLIRASLWAAEVTGGLVDPTLGSQLRAAGYDQTFELVRRREAWQLERTTTPTARWLDVSLDDTRRTLHTPPGVELDLGATAKAWAADQAAQLIAARTGSEVLVALGGDVAIGGRSSDRPWPVRIADDHAAPLDGPGPVVEIAAGGLATSGTAVRRWATSDGEAHHLLDPRTGRPAQTPWRTVSVAASTCLDANVAATAAVVLGERGADWLEDRRLPARAVRRDGSIVSVAGWPAEEWAA